MAVLALSWLVVICSHLKTAAQNPTAISTASVNMSTILSPNVSSTDVTTRMAFIPTVMMSHTIATSPSIINGGSVSLQSLVPTSAIMVTSQLPVDTTMPIFIISITTTVISPVHTIDTSSAMAVMTTTVVMTSSSVMPMTTAVVITTSNPVPVPSDEVSSLILY